MTLHKNYIIFIAVLPVMFISVAEFFQEDHLTARAEMADAKEIMVKDLDL